MLELHELTFMPSIRLFGRGTPSKDEYAVDMFIKAGFCLKLVLIKLI